MQNDRLALLPRICGVLMLAVFSLNAYVGSKDVTLSQLQPVHGLANFFIIVIDIISASILLVYGQGKCRWVLLSGIAWPATYILSLAADVESRMCLFTGANCFATVSDSYKYLILGEISEGWELWRYTIPTVISLLITIMILTSAYCLLLRRNNRLSYPK